MPKNKVKQILESNFKLKLYFLKHMPMGFFSGMKIEEYTGEKSSVSVPFNYFTKNPFRSVYFAVQAMAAELSSGLVALEAVSQMPVPVSMLVLEMKSEFTKKARTKITFTCENVKEIKQTVQASVNENAAKTITVTSTGRDLQGDVVSKFYITWTFKPKTK